MSKIPGVNHLQAIKALEKAGFRLIRQGKKHVVMTNGTRFLTFPNNIAFATNSFPLEVLKSP